MRFDRFDVVPFSAIAVFGFFVPFAFWLGYGTRKQILHDVRQMGLTLGLAFGALLVVLLTTVLWWRTRARKVERKLISERGEQTISSFVELFDSSAERKVAQLAYPMLQSFTLSHRMPLLPHDRLFEYPLWAAEEDIGDYVSRLCEELDVCAALNPEIESRLSSAKTVGELINSLAELVESEDVS